MIDTLFDAPKTMAAQISAALIEFPNVIGPVSGDAINGGDPTRLYWNVRADVAPDMPEGCEVTAPALSANILGVWA